MSLQVDFYVLESSDEQSRMKTVCRLADKVQRMGHGIHVLTVDNEQSKQLDNLMWTFSQSSFLPHAIFDDSDPHQDQHPVIIHHQALCEKLNSKEPEVLINLQLQAPQTNQYQRLVEIVNQDETVRTAGRDKYRAYKEKNYSIKTHKIPA